MDDDQIRTLLEGASTIAVVGASTDPDKAAGAIPRRLLDAGFEVIPVHPEADEVLGRKAYPSLAEVPGPVDVVDVFRPADEAPGIARDAVAAGAGAVWLQLGITSDEARAVADEAGTPYVEDRCIGQVVAAMGITRQPG
jgi:uncharacterized protein